MTTLWRNLAFVLPLLMVTLGGCTAQAGFRVVPDAKLEVVEVQDTWAVIQWKRQGTTWADCDQFNVTISNNEEGDIEFVIFQCNQEDCVFNTTDYCNLTSCHSYKLVVTDLIETASSEVSFTTAPGPMNNLITEQNEEAELIVTWELPEDITCLNKSVVRVTLNGVKTTINQSVSESTTIVHNLSLCEVGEGEVSVVGIGGDGHSPTVSEAIAYNGTGAAPIVTSLELIPDCTNMTVKWTKENACTLVDSFQVTVDLDNNGISTDNVNKTELEITDLESGKDYLICVTAWSRNSSQFFGEPLCENQTTVAEEIVDVIVESVNATSLLVTWDPPICMVEVVDAYMVVVRDSFNHIIYEKNVTETTCEVGKVLQSYTFYDVCVTAFHADSTNTTTCNTAQTLPAPPSDVAVSQSSDITLTVTWTYPPLPPNDTDKLSFNVTWNLEGEDDDVEYDIASETQYVIQIESYNNTQTYDVCVAAVRNASVSSIFVCEVFQPPQGPSGPKHNAGLIVGLIFGFPLGLAVVGAAIWFFLKDKLPS